MTDVKIKKLVVFLILVFIVSLVSVGCSSGGDTQKTANVAASNQGEKVVLPKDAPELMGRVKEIIGNEVTIYKAEIVENAGNAVEGQRPASPEEVQNNRGQGQTQTQGQGQRPDNMGARMKMTDQTETLIIPVGTPIVMMQRGATEANTVALTEIKKDQMLRIWKNDGEISLVQVISGMGAGNRQGQAAGNNGQQGSGGAGFGGAAGFGPPPGTSGGR